MGMIRSLFGLVFGTAGKARALGQSVTAVAEVFRPNATRQMELGHDAFMAAHASHAAEYQHARPGWFDTFVNGLNRLPRPMLAIGTLALFVYAMADPPGFTLRMQGLAEVPEPLWWLLGAVVAFYFGAREAHHLRCMKGTLPAPKPAPAPSATPAPVSGLASALAPAQSAASNPALAEWQATDARANPEPRRSGDLREPQRPQERQSPRSN